MKFIDFFSGIGGFRLGMETAGHECVGHCEIDKFADKSYRAMHDVKEGEWYASDIRAVEPGDLPEADCYCGGFPCQAFSVAGKRGGFEDTRGTLFFEVMRLATVRKPKYLFMENVAGLLSHDGGKTFGTILNTLGQLGYWFEYQVLNSKDFGVPQNRERVFIVGHLGGHSGREVFPITRSNRETLKQIIGGSQGDRVYDPSGVSCTLASQAGGKGAKIGLYMVPARIHKMSGNEFCSIKDASLMHVGDDTASTLTARYYKGASGHGDNVVIVGKDGKVKQNNTTQQYVSCLTGGGHSGGNHSDMDLIVQAVLTPNREEKRQNGRRIKKPGEPMFTLTSQDKHGIYDGARIRRLTPKECFRLQGFPDEYFNRAAEVNSDSQLYKQAGNSVTVNVIYEIARRLEG